MTRYRAILALVAIAAIGAGGYFAYDNVLRGDAIAPLALPSGPRASRPMSSRRPRSPSPNRSTSPREPSRARPPT